MILLFLIFNLGQSVFPRFLAGTSPKTVPTKLQFLRYRSMLGSWLLSFQSHMHHTLKILQNLLSQASPHNLLWWMKLQSVPSLQPQKQRLKKNKKNRIFRQQPCLIYKYHYDYKENEDCNKSDNSIQLCYIYCSPKNFAMDLVDPFHFL